MKEEILAELLRLEQQHDKDTVHSRERQQRLGLSFYGRLEYEVHLCATSGMVYVHRPGTTLLNTLFRETVQEAWDQ